VLAQLDASRRWRRHLPPPTLLLGARCRCDAAALAGGLGLLLLHAVVLAAGGCMLLCVDGSPHGSHGVWPCNASPASRQETAAAVASSSVCLGAQARLLKCVVL
jgi:hypothetical protein